MEDVRSLRSAQKARGLAQGAGHGCRVCSGVTRGQKTSLVAFLDGKFEICGACEGKLVNRSTCTKFRCSDPTLYTDDHPMMICSNQECQKVTHVSCEKPDIASKAMSNSNYMYYCFDCRSSRVRYKMPRGGPRPELSVEEFRKLWPLPKKRAVENYRYAYAESYKDIGELLAEAKLEPITVDRISVLKFTRTGKRSPVSELTSDHLALEEETELERTCEEIELKSLRRSKRIKKF